MRLSLPTYDSRAWTELIAMLGQPARVSGPHDKHFWCPACGSSDALHLFDEDGPGLYCFACGAGPTQVREALGAGATAPRSTTSSGRDHLAVARRTAYPVKTADGRLVAIHTRFDLEDGGKTFSWTFTGRKPWPALKDLPPYGIDLATDLVRPIVVVEGERCCDRLLAVGYQAVGLVGGAAVQPSPAALAPLAGRDVVLWPDNDSPGRAVMAYVAGALTSDRIAIVQPWPGAQPKDDAADYLDSHSVDECDALLLAAQPWDRLRPEMRRIYDHAPRHAIYQEHHAASPA
jgi:hypothetical protein